MLGLPRRTCYEAAQPVGGRQPQTPTQRVDPDHRTVDSGLLKTAQPRTHLRQVPTLDDHFPLTHVRRGARSKPLPRVLLPSPSLPLSWHPPRINGRRQEGKKFGSNPARPVIICRTGPREISAVLPAPGSPTPATTRPWASGAVDSVVPCSSRSQSLRMAPLNSRCTRPQTQEPGTPIRMVADSSNACRHCPRAR